MPSTPLRAVIALGCLCLVLAGCQSVPQRSGPTDYADEQARVLAAEGRFAESAIEYARLADLAPPSDARQFRLRAASAYLDAGLIDEARAMLAHPSLESGSEDNRARRSILLARADLAEGVPGAALTRLDALQFAELPAYLAREAQGVRALALSGAGDFAGAALQRISLELLLTEPEAISANRSEIWESISRLSPAKLAERRRPPPDTFGGWIELALIRARSIGDFEQFTEALAAWNQQFPGHPATVAVIPALLAESELIGKPPTHLALLLPLTGQFQAAAEAIRDGFLSAWFAERERSGAAPTVTVHDTGGTDPTAVYRQAVGAGANFVVGPLRKEAIAALVEAGIPGDAEDVPTLALNRFEPTGNRAAGARPFYQFSLAPEGEARQVAERAHQDGHTQAAVLVPDSDWGERVVRAFENRWSELGGVVVETQRYGTGANALADSVRGLLNIDESAARTKQVGRVLRARIEHAPRRRQDVELIFLAAFPRQARQLRPQIDYYRATEVPVYATSHVFSGQPNANADGDVNGIIFGDMPWVLGSGPAGEDAFRERVLAVWPGASGGFARLYAFGVDAYKLVPQLGRLSGRPDATIPGFTGILSVEPGNRVRRRLDWAIFDDGVPRPMRPPDT